MVTVIAKITAQKSKINEIKPLLESLVDPTLKEDGCIQYCLHQDIAKENIFFFYENWKNEGTLKAHSNTERFKEFQKKTESLIEKPIEIYLLNKI